MSEIFWNSAQWQHIAGTDDYELRLDHLLADEHACQVLEHELEVMLDDPVSATVEPRTDEGPGRIWIRSRELLFRLDPASFRATVNFLFVSTEATTKELRASQRARLAEVQSIWAPDS